MSEDPKSNGVAPTTSNQPRPEAISNPTLGEVPSPGETTPPTQTLDSNLERSELLSRARTFLTSPQIQNQDIFAKRQFLLDKGLNDLEVERLLRELPVPRPTIPPRTYPQPLPSNLPNLLLGLMRLFSWVAGGSAALVFVYYHFLLPRITSTSNARHSIKSHHLSLMRRLTASLSSLKESQAESYSVLPRPERYKEPSNFAACNSIGGVLQEIEKNACEMENIPPITLIRCGIADFNKDIEGDLAKPTTEELFQHLEGQIPWLISEDGLKYEQKLWETLSTCLLFIGTPSLPTPSANGEHLEDQKPTRWTYEVPKPQDPPPLLASLANLSSAFPKTPRQSPYHHTLQTLTDFTGYITTQIYLPYRGHSKSIGFPGAGNTFNPSEEEFRREIRALKGLVLNR
ncbi:hypothetical protein BDZ94DRAFT_1161228 [Collybia nuda]|uniref:Peroxisome membrane anchor protein Pex14p N-terminal domain-containing protein n=1 Tax=Collybia nuda TaxID=64659 RepID=A0A9P6CLM6_9AGAR|nr:hypothetical protein BDZ94DRAFT_1161228 [Collybia nuda]